MTQTAVVTGGAGFIGSHLADKLLVRGWHVVAFDNMFVGRAENIAHLRRHPRFTLVSGDIADRGALAQIIKDFNVHVLFHLAAVHYIPYCNEHPYETMRINVLGTQAAVDAVIMGKVGKIVFTSTCDVYSVRKDPHAEDDPVEPQTVYGTSKLFAERLLALAVSQHPNLSVTVARLSNVYGPRETNPHVLPDILSQLHNGDKPTVRLGNLWPRRDFVYVDDVTEALTAMISVGKPFEVFNIGSGQAFSIQEIMQIFSGLLGQKIRVETDPARIRPVERASLAANIDKARRILTWAPAWRLEDGLREWLATERA